MTARWLHRVSLFLIVDSPREASIFFLCGLLQSLLLLMGVTQACVVGKEHKSCSVFIDPTNKAISCFAEKQLFLDKDSMTWRNVCFLVHLSDVYFLEIEPGLFVWKSELWLRNLGKPSGWNYIKWHGAFSNQEVAPGWEEPRVLRNRKWQHFRCGWAVLALFTLFSFRGGGEMLFLVFFFSRKDVSASSVDQEDYFSLLMSA